MEEKDIGFGMVDSHKDTKVAKKLGEYMNAELPLSSMYACMYLSSITVIWSREI